MFHRTLISTLVVFWLMPPVTLIAEGEHGVADSPSGEVNSAASLETHLRTRLPKIRAEKKLIGLAMMVVRKGQTIAVAADGVRKKGTDVQVTTEDRWHLGSITKSITATMIGRLVEQNALKWNSTVGDVFGGSIDVDAAWRTATLHQLLTHTAGAPPNFPVAVQFKRPEAGTPRMKARLDAIANVLSEPPRSQPGTKFGYSNVGVTIAGVMAEQRTKTSWEELVRREVFAPLSLERADFGPPSDDAGTLSQPRGHQNLGPFKRSVSESDDNTPIMGPAGTVHMTLADLCAYGQEHLRGERGEGKLLRDDTYRFLHSPILDDYACGWVVPTKHEIATGRVLWHNGSNTMWYALVVLLPDVDAVVAVVSNDGDIRQAESAAFTLVKESAKFLE